MSTLNNVIQATSVPLGEENTTVTREQRETQPTRLSAPIGVTAASLSKKFGNGSLVRQSNIILALQDAEQRQAPTPPPQLAVRSNDATSSSRNPRRIKPKHFREPFDMEPKHHTILRFPTPIDEFDPVPGYPQTEGPPALKAPPELPTEFVWPPAMSGESLPGPHGFSSQNPWVDTMCSHLSRGSTDITNDLEEVKREVRSALEEVTQAQLELKAEEAAMQDLLGTLSKVGGQTYVEQIIATARNMAENGSDEKQAVEGPKHPGWDGEEQSRGGGEGKPGVGLDNGYDGGYSSTAPEGSTVPHIDAHVTPVSSVHHLPVPPESNSEILDKVRDQSSPIHKRARDDVDSGKLNTMDSPPKRPRLNTSQSNEKSPPERTLGHIPASLPKLNGTDLPPEYPKLITPSSDNGKLPSAHALGHASPSLSRKRSRDANGSGSSELEVVSVNELSNDSSQNRAVGSSSYKRMKVFTHGDGARGGPLSLSPFECIVPSSKEGGNVKLATVHSSSRTIPGHNLSDAVHLIPQAQQLGQGTLQNFMQHLGSARGTSPPPESANEEISAPYPNPPLKRDRESIRITSSGRPVSYFYDKDPEWARKINLLRLRIKRAKNDSPGPSAVPELEFRSLRTPVISDIRFGDESEFRTAV